MTIATPAPTGPTTGPRPLRDSLTMVRRRIVHMRRYPSLTIMLVAMPIVFLLLFVFVFGQAMGTGLAGPGGGRAEYLAFIAPTLLVMTVAGVAQATAIGVATDMTEGIVARFRTMAIARVSVLTGHVVGAFVQTALAVVVVLAAALAIGYRPGAGPVAWLAAVGVLALLTLALTWFTVALGLVARTVESSSNTPMFLFLLPFLGSGFVPTDSMPPVLRAFAEHQPFTPVIDTVRELLSTGATADPGTPALAVGWCLLITVASYAWARRLYDARASR